MSVKKRVLAFDYGASSGRAMLGDFDGNRVELTEIHRFLNEPVIVRGSMYWDILRLFHELKQGMLKADAAGDVSSMGIDTWGVDFGLLDGKGALLANPFHYRDSHTEHAVETLEETMPKKDLYAKVGLAFQKYNTLCQLVTMKKNGNPALERAEKLLFIPDLFNYFLTGKAATEFTIASTSQMILPGKTAWADDVLKAYGVPKKILSEILPTGTVLGNVSDEIKNELGLKKAVPVVMVPEHDTASAFVSVPAGKRNSAFLSSGTWSLLGTELDNPVLTEEALLSGYTNEGGAAGNIRFLKNIMGLWIIQECKRYWDKAGEKLSFAEIAAGAEQVPACKFIMNPDDDRFFSPLDMPKKVQAYCAEHGLPVPETKFEIARCIYDSLALDYRYNVEALEKITGKKVEVLHIVGGGANNKMLNQATSDALHREVTAGPSEGTALGNVLQQLISQKEIANIAEAREVVKRSTDIGEYHPQNSAVYDAAYEKFLKLL